MVNYANRVKNSFVGVLFGLLMVPGSIALQAWNEYRTVHRARGLEEAVKLVQTVGSVNEVDSKLDGKLVHLTGKAETDETLRDTEFSVSRNAIRLARRVEMYQWVEDSHNEGSGNNKRTVYTYKTEWKDSPVSDSSFHEQSGHKNPPMSIRSTIYGAAGAHVGAYFLNENLRDDMENWQRFPVPQQDVLENVPEERRSLYKFQSDTLFFAETQPDPSNPRVGDYRIYFEEVLPAEVSLVAQLKGNSFTEFRTSNGEPIERLVVGNLSGQGVIDQLKSENTVLAWILRLVGLVVCIVGCALIMGPLSAIFSFIPFLGDLAGGVTFFVALVFAFAISLFTIGISWVVVRPVLGVSLIALSIAGLWLMRSMRKEKPTSGLVSSAPPPIPSETF